MHILLFGCGFNCGQKGQEAPVVQPEEKTELPTPSTIPPKIMVGVKPNQSLFPHSKGKNVTAAVVNQDFRDRSKPSHRFFIKCWHFIKKYLHQEHGFGRHDSEHVKDGIDIKEHNCPSFHYTAARKTFKEDLKNIDFIIFDIQDVGSRFCIYLPCLFNGSLPKKIISHY
ncbi:MAG: DUF1343 domain-containing protein [Saprospiraceae bacterium]